MNDPREACTQLSEAIQQATNTLVAVSIKCDCYRGEHGFDAHRSRVGQWQVSMHHAHLSGNCYSVFGATFAEAYREAINTFPQKLTQALKQRDEFSAFIEWRERHQAQAQ